MTLSKINVISKTRQERSVHKSPCFTNDTCN